MEENTSPLEQLSDTIESVVTGIPAPIRKNFWKAFGQLCTAAVDVPVAALESKVAEIRALSDARVKVINKQGEDLYTKSEAPTPYVLKAGEKYASKIIREQLNLDDITKHAAHNLTEAKVDTSNEETKELSSDWLNEFESNARLKSSEDMKLIYGKILSGEILQPGKYSIRTIKLMSQLDNEAAKLFQILCSLSVSIQLGQDIIDARVISLGSASQNSLAPYGLSFDKLNILQEYGLIITDYNSYFPYNICIVYNNGKSVASAFKYQGKNKALLAVDGDSPSTEFKVNGVAFTKAGRELLSIIPQVENPAYTKRLIEYFQSKSYTIVDVTD
jgi:hypothetical protein